MYIKKSFFLSAAIFLSSMNVQAMQHTTQGIIQNLIRQAQALQARIANSLASMSTQEIEGHIATLEHGLSELRTAQVHSESGVHTEHCLSALVGGLVAGIEGCAEASQAKAAMNKRITKSFDELRAIQELIALTEQNRLQLYQELARRSAATSRH